MIILCSEDNKAEQICKDKGLVIRIHEIRAPVQ